MRRGEQSHIAAAVPAAPSADTRFKATVYRRGRAILRRCIGEMHDGKFIVPAVRQADLAPAFRRTRVAYAGNEKRRNGRRRSRRHYLYHVMDGGQAMRYGVGVGREGFAWSGEATIHNKQEWPDWYPPKEMLERRPDLANR